jgi:hypothetical protein
MIEVFTWIVGHAELLHHAAGAHIGGHGERHEFIEVEHVECVTRHGSRAFGGQPFTPMGRVEPPADLDAGHEGGLKAGHGQPDEADEFACLAQFRCPQPEAMLLKVRFDAIKQGAAFVRRERGREKLHYERITIDAGKGFAIRVAPAAEKYSIGVDFAHAAIVEERSGRRNARMSPAMRLSVVQAGKSKEPTEAGPMGQGALSGQTLMTTFPRAWPFSR